MINGAFGVGKTTVSMELLKQVENSMLFDPEEVGFMLRNIIPIEIKQMEATTGDFQDLELWKELTVTVAKSLTTKYKKNLIVPMTIHNEEYFNYIFNGFKNIDEQTYHFCLVANESTIFERLRNRGEEEGNWCFQQTRKCIEAFKGNSFEEYINTEDISVDTIVSNIKEKLSNS
ncbi:AAA family ATPase [Heyndrickxia sp. NPDC080065]|uniref:AAA family ATPase n=1 Tax=Heyndrickxia sp. NPDC080065 TaxID=3390568 RepID=UPI003D08ADB5